MMTYRADAVFCSTACRMRHYRASKRARTATEAPQTSPLPSELTDRPRWIRWRSQSRSGGTAKAPRRIDGTGYASSTDPSTWGTYEAAAESDHGTGLGFVLNGDGIACVDLDNVITDGVLDSRAEALISELTPFYVEISPSGAGVHAWVYGGSPDGRSVFTRPDGLKVEWYSHGRYLTITGRKLDAHKPLNRAANSV